MTDPYYQKILERLGGELDPQVFEDCMADLLRSDFPGLVPVRGGKDSGMDGAIADGEGEAYPLICTTARDVRRNLRGSLRSYLKAGRPRRKAVFATSQSLTPQQRLDLEELARNEEFMLVQVVERRGVANLLYHSSRWCRDLLELSGRPSALSTVPVGGLPIDIEPVGRDGDLEWLRTTAGDRLLVGGPGSGKTFLLHHLTREDWGLFLSSDDKTEIDSALRDQEPKIVIVDDAHAYPDRIELLRGLREEIGAEFAIVATTWKYEEDPIAEALGGLDSSRIRCLDLLTRAEIKEILEKAGVQAKEVILRELIDQSANKPGLAVTLARLCLQGAWEDVLLGKALARKLLTFFHNWVGREVSEILACFALGGDAGMPMLAVAEFLGMDMASMRQKAVALAAGGVLSEEAQGILAVRPRALRSVLLGSVFFEGVAALPNYRTLLEKAPSLEETIGALVTARGYGIKVPLADLQELMRDLGSDRVWLPRVRQVWCDFAILGEDEARWTLDHYPGDVTHVAWEALHGAPQETIRRLLKSAEQEASALECLSGWLGSDLGRRRLLAREVRRYLHAGGDRQVGIQAACTALSLGLRSSESDALGRQVNDRFGVLPKEALAEMCEIWSGVLDAIRESVLESWSPLILAIGEWIHPRYPVVGDEKYRTEHQEERFAIVRRVLRDLEPLASGSPGAAAGLRRLASRVELDLDLAPDDVFELLYPSEDDSEEHEACQNDDMSDLAAHWAAQPASETLERLRFYENEARRIGHGWPRLSPDICRHLAQRVENPVMWADEAMDRALSADLVVPFLKRLVGERREGFEKRLERCLADDAYAGIALALVLGLDGPSAGLLEKAIGQTQQFAQLVQSMGQRSEIPVPTLVHLLRDASRKSAFAAAVGEWLTPPRGSVRDEVQDAWHHVVLQAKPGDLGISEYWLGEILAADTRLADEWLRRHLKPTDPMTIHMKSRVLGRAIGALSREQRMMLLDELEPSGIMVHVLAGLIQRDPDVYTKLLGLRRFGRLLHLAPLQGIPDDAWVELALVALDAGGYSARDVAGAAFDSMIHSGITVEYWRKWEDAFGRLLHHSRDEIREVARHGIEEAERLREDARAFERRRQL